MNSSEPSKDKIQKWKANHLGTFLLKGSPKDATNAAFTELSAQLTNGKYRDLQCTISIDRNKLTVCIKRWLDNVLLDEYPLENLTNVNSFQEVPQNKALCNIVTFVTQKHANDSNILETHIFQLEDSVLANYLASDIRSAKETSAITRSKSSPVKVLPTNNPGNTGRFDNFNSIRQIEDITSKTERNLLLLNYCFDDIEVFIQHLKDQEDARQMLATLKKKSIDRLLEGKAKPSTASAYQECVQKIKFCFNLLSKLNGKIKNPDSHELCRLLMEHLIKIGLAFNNYHNGRISKVKEPLLLQQAVLLLQNSLPKDHFRTWNGWGDNWIKPRERWAGYEEKFIPKFFNGYEIDIEEMVKDGMVSPSVDLPKNAPNNTVINELIYARHPVSTSSPPIPSPSTKVPLTQRQEDFCRSVRLKDGKLYRVFNTYTAIKDQELSLTEGEIIEVVESWPDRNWWLCANMQGQRGFSPNTILEPFNFVDRALDRSSGFGTSTPPSPASPENRRPISTSGLSRSFNSPPTLPKDSLTMAKSIEEAKTINEELKTKISSTSAFGNPLGRASFARPRPIVSKKHGQISINQDSSSEEVQNWLKFKSFSDEDVEKLKEFTGQTLFLMSREQMNRIVGIDVAARLDSFIKVQKSMSGFGTMSRKELDDILLKRKSKIDYEETF